MNQQDHVISIVRNTADLAQQQQLGEATSLIQYESLGHALIIGEQDQALAAAARFHAHGATVVSIDESAASVQKQLTDTGVAVFTVPQLHLSGYLGAFKAMVPAAALASDTAFDLAVSVYRESACFDVVLDLSIEPLLPVLLPPFGYRHAADAESLNTAIEELAEMQGEFEKPRYFNYNERICAHSRSELAGCQNCIDVCSTGAIVSDGEGVKVDPYLCQGCGSCATVCPSGAMSYAYPRPSNAIERSRNALRESSAKVLLLHTEADEVLVSNATLDDAVLPMVVEEVTAFGPDYWLSMLAGYALRIVLLNDSKPDQMDAQAISSQTIWVHELLQGLGCDEQVINVISSAELMQHNTSPVACLSPAAWQSSQLATLPAQDFSTHNDKRQTIRLALDALSEHLTPLQSAASLSQGAPFGHIAVDTQACTLCMACVSTCPAQALQDGQDTPALRFVESNCLQCGLCEAACPESAISLEARYTWDSISARRVNTLNEEQPFHCLRCHTAFSTQSMIRTMTSKLAGHWMFQDEKAVRRLKLCGDCRVRDLFEENAKGIDVHKGDAQKNDA